MQHDRIPAGVCRELEKIQRDFIWGSTDEKRRLHPVSWERVCMPREQGGLGIRELETMNKALMGRIAWNMLVKPECLCSMVLREKYGREADLYSECSVKRTDSGLWKYLASLWKEITSQIAWECKDGRSVKFWKDIWLKDEVCLFDKAIRKPAGRLLECSVSDMVNERGEWELVFLKDYLDEREILCLRATPVPCVDHGTDTIRWKGSSLNKYCVSEMYNKMRGGWEANVDSIWKTIWRWKGPRRVQVHLWLCVQDRLLTSSRRAKMVGGSALCGRCQEGDEDLLHALRDCRRARRVWEAIGGEGTEEGFFKSQLNVWLAENLNKGDGWARMFAVTCWWQWQWRNKFLFEEGFTEPALPDIIIRKYVDEVKNLSGRNGPLDKRKRIIDVRWLRPTQDWVKLNFDGAVKGASGLAGCGGVLRDCKGVWLKGYMKKIGVCNAYNAELWGVFWGLKVANDMGVKQLVVEGDSKVVISLLSELREGGRGRGVLQTQIADMLNADWRVMLQHTYREGNKVADRLASMCMLGNFELMQFDSVPFEIQDLVLNDCMGVSCPREV